MVLGILVNAPLCTILKKEGATTLRVTTLGITTLTTMDFKRIISFNDTQKTTSSISLGRIFHFLLFWCVIMLSVVLQGVLMLSVGEPKEEINLYDPNLT